MTVLDRLTSAGYSEDQAREAVTSGRVQVDGVPAADVDVPVAEDAWIVERIVWPN